jgi:hypothetical protein
MKSINEESAVVDIAEKVREARLKWYWTHN